jgi:hypothetical protein
MASTADALRIEQAGSGDRDDRTRGDDGNLLDSCYPSATLELAYVVAPPVGPGCELGLGHGGPGGQQVDELTQPMSARGDRRQLADARRCAQRVDDLHFACRRTFAQRLGQRRGEHLAERMMVVLGRPGQQTEQRRGRRSARRR